MFESFILLALTFIVFPGINTQFQHFVSHVDSLEQTTLSQNLINSFEKLDDYFSSGMIPPGTGTHAQEQSDVSDFELETAYPGYTFFFARLS